MKMGKKKSAAFVVGAWVAIGAAFAGATFTYKLLEIIKTISMDEAAGFAVIQVVTYLFVAVGFFSLFIWSFLKGDFQDIESVKYRVLEMEEKACNMEKRLGHGRKN